MNSLTSKHNKGLIQWPTTGAHFRRAIFSAGGPPSSDADKLKKWFERDQKSETLYLCLVFGNTVDSHQPEDVIRQKYLDDKSKRLHEFLLQGIKHSEESSKVEMKADSGTDVLAEATDLGENTPLPDAEAGRVGTGYQKFIILVAFGQKLAHIYKHRGIDMFPLGVNRFVYTINLPGLVHNSAVAWIENKSL